MAASVTDRFRLLLSRWLVSPLDGVTFGDWYRVLRDNRFAISPPFWPRALLTTLLSLVNSVQARRQKHHYGARIAAATVRGPIFILGHYRSGTTHLHNLLAVDLRLAYPNNYQANQPHTFLVTESVGARLGAAFTMRKRPHDDVDLNLQVPTEDELAICADCFLSPHMGWHFPRRADHYGRRYLTFADANELERARWIDSIRSFARKLAVKNGERRLVLKSPLHTARVPLLLEAFPDAVFVHVHRDPYRVFQSTRNMERKVEPLFRYQRSRTDDLDERILWRYRALYDAFLDHRSEIPDARLVEISYRELVADRSAALQRIYAHLQLPDFEHVRPAVERYLESLRGYRKNRYPDLDEATRQRVGSEWARSFAEWGYPRD